MLQEEFFAAEEDSEALKYDCQNLKNYSYWANFTTM